MKELQKLAQCLEKEVSFQEAVLKVLTKERAAIVSLNHDDIEHTAQEKEQLLEKISSIKLEREDLMSQVALEHEISPEKLNLKTIIECCDSETLKEQFATIREELGQIATTVRDMNTHNSALVRQSLQTISSSLAIIYSAADGADSETYGAAGEVPEKKKSASSGRLRTSV